jgi:hypothetical protein
MLGCKTRFTSNPKPDRPLLAKAVASITLIICVLAFSLPAAEAAQFLNERHAYLRGERAALRFQADADSDEVAFQVGSWLAERVKPDADEPRFVVDTSLLRAGDYMVRAQPFRAGKAVGDAVVFSLSVAPERNPQRYPVWNWNTVSMGNMRSFLERGINGARLGSAPDPVSPRGGGDARLLDEATRRGMDLNVYPYPLLSRRWAKEEAALCVLPDGQRSRGGRAKPYPREPIVLEHARRTAESLVNRYADYPSLRGVLVQSEYQTPFCVNESAKQAARAEAGLDLAAVLRAGWVNERGANPGKLPPELQPKDGVIPDDHLAYRFLKWWWERGHGTSVCNQEIAVAFKAKRPDLLTWHDPYRLAPVYHSHDGLDCISTWTYGHPDIKRLCYPTVLQAAAKPGGQKIMQTITLFTYGRFVMPIGKSTANPAADQAGRDQSFVNTPDFAREATWLALSYRPDVLGYYHTGSGETMDAIGDVCRALVEPYGPTLLQCRRPSAKVAVLLSAAATWFPARPSGYGYPNEQILPYCALLLMNHVPFEVVLDEDVAAGKLKDYETLVIPRGDTLTKSVHEQIVAFAQAGKKVIATKTLRAKVPGVSITDFEFAFERQVDGTALAAGRAVTAEEHRQRMETYAAALKPLLAGMSRPAESTSPRALLNTLESGDLRYVFVINDERTYGPQFGKWKLVFEKGVRQETRVRVAATGTPVLYDALARRPLPHVLKDGHAEVDVTLDPAAGKLIAVLPEAIGKVEIDVPGKLERGKRCIIGSRVRGSSGRPLQGSLPLRVDILDPDGKTNEFSRYAATDNQGRYELGFVPALNDAAGEWTVRITELLGGTQTERKFRLPE